MGRHARGNEISCGAGGCRNLAEWLLLSDLSVGRNSPSRFTYNWLSCGLHLDPRRRLMVERKMALRPEVVPFQDPTEVSLTKRKHQRR